MGTKQNKFLINFLAAIITLFGLGACMKGKDGTIIGGYTLTGVDPDQLRQDPLLAKIDYASLFQDSLSQGYFLDGSAAKKTLTFSIIFSYDRSSLFGERGGVDKGTEQTFNFINWLKAQDQKVTGQNVGKFKRGLEYPDGFNLRGTRGEVTSQQEVVTGEPYSFSAMARNIALTYDDEKSSEKTEAVVDILVKVFLGSSIQTSLFEAGQRGLNPAFGKVFVDALINADVAIYNGHLWTTDIQSNGNDSEFLDNNTKWITDEITRQGGRKKYGVLFFNMCKGEMKENALYNALKQGNSSIKDPIILSHKNFSDYGFFGKQITTTFDNILDGQPLTNLLDNLTEPEYDPYQTLSSGYGLIDQDEESYDTAGGEDMVTIMNSAEYSGLGDLKGIIPVVRVLNQ